MNFMQECGWFFYEFYVGGGNWFFLRMRRVSCSEKETVSIVKDFRPSSLVMSIYKNIAIVANCFRKILPSTIPISQGAFVAGAQILDQVLIANDAIEDHREGKRMIFKIDFEKAFDHVDWEFLDTTLGKKEWLWLQRENLDVELFKKINFSILLNGKPRD